jgi:hypothetical protein
VGADSQDTPDGDATEQNGVAGPAEPESPDSGNQTAWVTLRPDQQHDEAPSGAPTPVSPAEEVPPVPLPQTPASAGDAGATDGPQRHRTWQTWQLAVASVAALVIGFGAGAAANSGSKSHSSSASGSHTTIAESTVQETTVDTTAITTAETTTTEAPAPTPADFNVTLNVVDSTCFDTAGANVTVQPQVHYAGAADLTDATWHLTYQVQGGGNSDIHTIDGNGSQYDAERETISTPTCHDTLTATVLSVTVDPV